MNERVGAEKLELEKQIEALADIGIALNEGVSVDDFLTSYSRHEYEEAPFDLILFVYGMEIEQEPWGRYFCDRAWDFDLEAIEDHGSYSSIVEQFHRMTGKAKTIEGLTDEVDLENGHALLKYVVDGEARTIEPKVDDDWADSAAVETVMRDLKEPGFDFYPKDNGQASTWFYLNESQAEALDELADGVFGIRKKPWWKFW